MFGIPLEPRKKPTIDFLYIYFSMIKSPIIFYKFSGKDGRIQWQSLKLYGIYDHDHIIINRDIFSINNLSEYKFFSYKNNFYPLNKWQFKDTAINYFGPSTFKIRDESMDPII